MDNNYSPLLSKLLSDMETFLISNISDTELHTAAEEKRKELLKEIEMFRHLVFPESEEYIEMNGNHSKKDKAVTDATEELPPEYINGYVNDDAEGSNENSKNTQITSGICNDYENEDVLQADDGLGWPPGIVEEPSPLGQINSLSAPALKAMTVKCGPLQRKDRFMFMDQFRRVWVGLHGHHLYFYGSDKDNKPNHSLDISDYTVHHAPEAIKDSKKKPLCFEMVCPGNKTQQFIARSPKDMEQWIAAIRRANKNNYLKQQRNSMYDDAADTKTKIPSSQKDTYPTRCISDDSEYAIYHDIQDGVLPENLYDDAVGPRGTYSSNEETYDDVGAWRERLDEEVAEIEDKVANKIMTTDEKVVTGGIHFPVGSGRIRQLVRFMEEEGVIKGDECGRRRDEGGGGKTNEEGKDH